MPPQHPAGRTARAVLAASLAAGLLACEGGARLGRSLFDYRPPRARYEAALDSAGLAGTALVRDWRAAADRALAEAPTVAPPHAEEGVLGRADVAALAFRVSVRRGQEVTFRMQLAGDSTSLVFLDAWRVADSTGRLDLVASADSGERTLTLEPRRAGDYVFRAQPELLRGGRFTVSLELAPTLAFPVSGGRDRDIGSSFGAPRDGGARSHQGIDIFARRGTPALATGAAVVARVSENRLGGLTVWLRDHRGNRLYYAHLDSQLVFAGQRVVAGDTVGLVGNTGNARTTPPHLHFGVYRRGEGPVDPRGFVERVAGRLPRLRADTLLLGVRGRLTRATDVLAAPAARALARDSLPRDAEVLVLSAVGSYYRVQLASGESGYVEAGRVRAAPVAPAAGRAMAASPGGAAGGTP